MANACTYCAETTFTFALNTLIGVRQMLLDSRTVPSHLLAGYRGKSVTVEVCDTVSIPADAGTWSGGSRELYTAVRLCDGERQSITDTFSPPWDASRRNQLVTLKPGFAILETGTFCGKDSGLRFYVHPNDAAPLLPAPSAAISDNAKRVLNVICAYISSARNDEYRYLKLSASDVETAKAELFAVGFIDKRGAATIAGKNARNAKVTQ